MPDIEDVLTYLSTQLDNLNRHTSATDARTPSRWVGSAADADAVTRVAAGETLKTVSPSPLLNPYRGGLAETMTKALAEATASAGGYLVPSEISAEVLISLRARSAVMRMGPRIVPVKKDLAIVSLSSGAAASYVGENLRIPVSEQTFAQAPLLAPKQLAALVPVSNRLLRDAQQSPDIEQVIRDDLAEVLALKADSSFIRGTGADGGPIGIRNISGLTPAPSLGTNGRTPTFDDLKDMVANLRAVNAPFERPGWIFHPRLLSTLEKFKTGDGTYLADAGLLTFDPTGGGGTLLGFRFVTTTQIPVNLSVGSSNDATEVVFSSDWTECWIGENESLVIELSGEAAYTVDGTAWQSAFQQNQTLFRALLAHDLGLRRPQLFEVMTGVRP
jgi:HK97 family phage major capsid protein